jgi:hypothetical protein
MEERGATAVAGLGRIICNFHFLQNRYHSQVVACTAGDVLFTPPGLKPTMIGMIFTVNISPPVSKTGNDGVLEPVVKITFTSGRKSYDRSIVAPPQCQPCQS